MPRDDILYRYTAGGDGIFMAEDEMKPPELAPQIEASKEWLPSPKLPSKNVRFYMKKKGKDLYEKTLRPLHQRFMPPITCEAVPRSELGEIVYEDEFQVAERKK